MEQNKQDTDYLNKRIADLEKLVNTADKKWWPLVAVVLLGIVVWQQTVIINYTQLRVEDLKPFTREVVREVAKDELQETKTQVKETTEEVKKTINELKEKTQ